ncbi:MAG: hypothetical protein SGARI_001869, partial [Bacillariaceae sp.]
MSTAVAEKQMDDDDEFGAFETSAVTATATDFSSLPEPSGTVPAAISKDFPSANNAAKTDRTMSAPSSATSPQPFVASDVGRSLSIDDAFGDMSSPQNVPLPLETMGTPAPTDHPQDPTASALIDDDAFGGFEEPIGAESMLPQATQANPAVDFGGFQTSTNAAQFEDTASEADAEEEDFGGDIGAAAPVGATDSAMMGFGTRLRPPVSEIGRVMSEPVTSMLVPAPPGEIGRSLSIDDAFEGMAVQVDNPLPSM